MREISPLWLLRLCPALYYSEYVLRDKLICLPL
nr:MAG TPA: hypothetical protein [Caudoviricetes sp.]